MTVIMHYPKTENGRKALRDAVAKVHSDIVIDRLTKLNCPVEQKYELIKEIEKECKR